MIIGAETNLNDGQEEIEPTEYVRLMGEVPVDAVPPMLLISAGIIDTNRIEFYKSDSSGDWLVKFLPFHILEEIGWKNRRKASPEMDEPAPLRTVYTDHGLMIKMDQLPEDELRDVLFDGFYNAKDASIFPETPKDEWDW